MLWRKRKVRLSLKKALAHCLGAFFVSVWMFCPVWAQNDPQEGHTDSFSADSSAVKCWKLSSGLTVVAQHIPGCPAAAVALLVPAGAANDPQQRSGLAHITEHLVYRAAPDCPAGKMALEWEQMSARRGALTTADYVLFWEVVPASACLRALEIESGRFRGLAVDAESLKNEKRLLADELQKLRNNRWRTVKEQTCLQLAAGSQSSSAPIQGRSEDIAQITEKELREFYNRCYKMDNAVLAIVGGYNEEVLNAELEQLFVSGNEQPALNPVALPGADGQVSGRNAGVASDAAEGPESVSGAVLWVSRPQRNDLPIYAVVEALNWLGPTARWKQIIRERGWQENVDIIESECGEGLLAWAVGVKEPLDPREVGEALQADWLSSADSVPLYPELEAARKRALVKFYRRWQEPQLRAQMLAKAQYRGDLQKLIAFPRSIRACTPRQVSDCNRSLAASIPKAFYASRQGGDYPHTYGPGPGEVFAVETAEHTVMENGVRLAFSADPQQPMIYLRGYIEGGSLCDPPDRPGLTCFAAGLLAQGLDRRTGRVFAEELGERGMTLSFKGDRQVITVSGSCMREDINRFLDILCNALLYSEPDDAWVAAWRRQFAAELKKRENSFEDRAFALLMEKLYPPAHPFGRYYGGNSETAAGFSRDEALRHLRRCLQPQRLGLCFSGGVNAEIAAGKLSSRLGEWGGNESAGFIAVSKAERADKGRRFCVRHPGQEYIMIGQLGPGRRDPDYAAFALLNQILAGSAHLSRLPLRIVHIEHLGSAVSGRLLPSRDTALWVAAARLHNGKSERALSIVKQEMTRLVEPGPSNEEIERAKTALENRLLLQAANPPERVGLLCTIDYYRLDDNMLYDVRSIYRNITPVQLHVAAKKWFDPTRLTVVMSEDTH